MNSNTFTSLLLLVFITLKLLHKIDWSWTWVLSPFWIPFSLYLVVKSLLLIYYRWFESSQAKSNRKLSEILERLRYL